MSACNNSIYEMRIPGKRNETAWPESLSHIYVSSNSGERMMLPVLPNTNMLVNGVPGTGKTFFTKAYAAEYLAANKDTHAVFFEIKKDDYTSTFYQGEDKIIAYDPRFEGGTLFKWNMIREIRQANNMDTEIEEISASFFQDLIYSAQNNLVWANAAKETFAAVLKTVVYCYKDCPSNKLLINRIKNMSHSELLAFVAKYPPNRTMLKNNYEYDPDKTDGYVLPRKGTDTMFFLQYVIGKFGGSFLEDGEDTVHHFLHAMYGRHLFIVHDFAMAESMQMFERYFLRKIITEKLSSSSDLYGEPMLLVLDEVDKVGYDFGLFNAVTVGRQFGISVILSTQSIESLYNIAPNKNGEHIANSSLAGLSSVIAAFRPGDSVTIDTLQTLFGDTDRVKTSFGLSRSEKAETKIVTEPIVTTRMLQSLGLGECYVKVKEADPVRCRILMES